MLQEHSFDASNHNHLYERKHLGGGRYYQRGICKGIAVGDEFKSFTGVNTVLKVDKVLSVNDSKWKFKNPDNAKGSLYEAELVDEGYSHPSHMLFNIGFSK